MDYILAIDIGTTNCKAVTFDMNGQTVLSLKDGYETYTDDTGKSEQNPDEVFAVAWQLILKSLKINKEIKAVSFSAAMHSLIAIDKEGKSLTNAILWSDTRSIIQAEKLKKTEKGKTIYANTGTPVHPMSPLCKIIWLRETMPDVFANTSKFISIKEYIFLKLFGSYVIDYSIASATGLFHTKNISWCEEALEEAGITSEHLSQPVEITHTESKLLPQYNSQTSASSLSFIIGGNDGCLANLGSGIVSPGDASLTIGTSGAVRMTTKNIYPDQQQRLFTYLLTKDIYITGGAINNGGIIAEWISNLLLTDNTPNETDNLLALASTIPAGADNLLFLPYLLGERAPMWDANAKGVLFGLTLQHTKAHIACATIEGICFALCSVMQATEEVNGKINLVYASGGFTKSRYWLQTMANISGKEIRINSSSDASATGAAIVAMYALQWLDDLTDASRFFSVHQTFVPDATAHQKYNELFAVFQSLYPILKDSFTAIGRL